MKLRDHDITCGWKKNLYKNYTVKRSFTVYIYSYSVYSYTVFTVKLYCKLTKTLILDIVHGVMKNL